MAAPGDSTVATLALNGDMTATEAELTVYTTAWCGFCFRLKTGLKAAGIGYREIDIDKDPTAASFVTSVNGGNRTVPTVRFADGSTLTNPATREVSAKLAGLGQS